VRVLVAYASRHGSTAGIAERIAARLGSHSLDATACDVSAVADVDEYDAFVVGSAAYMYRWLKQATRFTKRHRKVLAEKPLWLFSSGPVGTDLVDEKGRDIFEAMRPKEFDELETSLHPRDSKVLFGAWDPDAAAEGLAERFMNLMPAAKASMPSGDFRDWEAIDAWADEIAATLRAP
jgi:menaquinone-dependent protoporphyrinogen oxidase